MIWHQSREGVLLGAHLGLAIVTSGNFTALCATAPQPSELRFGVLRAVGRGIAVLDGVHVVQGEREVSGVFVLHFHNGKCHCITDAEIFLLHLRKLHNVSVRQMYRWKTRFMGFLVIPVYSVSTSTLWFMRN